MAPQLKFQCLMLALAAMLVGMLVVTASGFMERRRIRLSVVGAGILLTGLGIGAASALLRA